jgi:ribosome-binding factor A
MSQGSRPERIGEELRQELSQLLLTDVRDPGIGLITLTRVKVSPDLQVARAYYSLLGDAKAKAETKKALERAIPYLRRQIAARVRLRRVPELYFQFDESVEKQDRIEKILLDLKREREERGIVDETRAAEDAGPVDEADPAAPSHAAPAHPAPADPEDPS